MNLIDKYITEVGKHLPARQRADIEAEIRSTLEDMLEDRPQTPGESKEARVVELLKEFGPPQEVASRYQTRQHPYLIGPRLFPILVLVTRTVFAALMALSLIGLGTDLIRSGFTATGIVSSLGEWFAGTLSALMTALGYIVLVLAIMERTKLGREIQEEAAKWDPRELYKTPDPDQIDPPDHIATILFTFLGVVILNLYPNLISIHVVNNGIQTSLPILTESFFRFLPWINVMSLLLIGFNAFMLSQRLWKTLTRSLSILIDIATATLSITILRTPGILGLTPEALTALGLKDSANELAQLANSIPILIMAIVVVATLIKVVITARRLLPVQPSSLYSVMK